jgi:hypothetical protein
MAWGKDEGIGDGDGGETKAATASGLRGEWRDEGEKRLI